MVLKQIRTRNIQNHREVVIDLPPTGLIVFTGDNSNGKSVIGKVTKMLVNGGLTDPRERADKVNRDSVSGEVEYIRDDGAKLLAHIQREANATYVELHLPDHDSIRRYLADKSFQELIYQFGFHYDPVSEISIQLAEADEALLFYKTSLKSNGRILASALTDPNAEVTAENLTNTIKETQRYRDVYNTKLATLLQTVRGLNVEDVDPLKEKLQILQKCQRNLSVIYFPTIPEIHAVPDVRLVELHMPKLPKIKYPRIYDVSCSIPDITETARELKSLMEMTCPTCGRRFEEHAGEDLVHLGHAQTLEGF